MKLKVKIAGRIFEVEIQDLHARPIIALVDGEPVEVRLEEDTAETHPSPTPSAKTKPASSGPTEAPAAANAANGTHKVYAPIPGIIASISVQPGAVVAYGQELCVLEAMKMKNAIRASRAGRIGLIHVSVGQQVKHHDVLMDYAES